MPFEHQQSDGEPAPGIGMGEQSIDRLDQIGRLVVRAVQRGGQSGFDVGLDR